MNYSIDDQHGTNICGGLNEFRARKVAQEYANQHGAPVLLYVDGSVDEGETVHPEIADRALPTVDLGSWRDHMEAQNERIARRGE